MQHASRCTILRRGGAFALLVIAAAPSVAQADTVLRRGELAALTGSITLIDAAGVHLVPDESERAPGAAPQPVTIPWHTVRDVESARHDDEWRRLQPSAEQLWRAVARVERGDPALAEPQFERLFEQSRGQTHETALVIAEGLLRCRIARAANEQAVVPWLEAARNRAAGVTTSAYADLPNVIDADTLLCPQLPPAWANTSRAQRLRDELSTYEARDDETIAALASLYARFADLALGAAPATPTVKLPKHAGVTILADILALRTSAMGGDAASVERTLRRAAEWPVWAQAWFRFHLGLTLRLQGERAAQNLGLVQLAYVPARHRHQQPYLAGLALHELAAALEARGELERSSALRRLVYERYPGHPAAQAGPRDRTPDSKARP